MEVDPTLSNSTRVIVYRQVSFNTVNILWNLRKVQISQQGSNELAILFITPFFPIFYVPAISVETYSCLCCKTRDNVLQ